MLEKKVVWVVLILILSAVFVASTENSETDIKILQIDEPLTEEGRSELEDKVEIVKPLNTSAFLVKDRRDRAEEFGSTEEFDKEKKLHPDLQEESEGFGIANNQDDEQKVVIVFESEDAKREALEKVNIDEPDTHASSGRVLEINTTPETIETLVNLDEVQWVEPFEQPQIMNAEGQILTGVRPIWDTYGLRGSGQIVAIADTGIDVGLDNDTMHPDLQGRFINISDWHNGRTDDQRGHGTHVSGSAVGNGNASGADEAAANYSGTFAGWAPNATIHFQSIGDASNSVFPPGDLNILFNESYNYGARVHTNSWGGGNNGEYNSDSSEADEFMWNYTDMVILFAAGNSGGSGTNTIAYPGTAKNVITIGATNNIGDGDVDTRASFSAQGPTDDNRIKPDLVAPGNVITSTVSSISGISSCNSLTSNRNYSTCQGTSMATPMVAGSAALAREFFIKQKNITPDAALIKATLISGADIIGDGPSNQTGWGRINLTTSFFPELPRINYFFQNKTGLQTGESQLFTFGIENASIPLKVTLVWTDYPASGGAGTKLINNLNLKVTNDSHDAYGNDFFDPRNENFDDINNVEVVEIYTTGQFTVNVSAASVSQGPQPYALVVSGALDQTPPSLEWANPIAGTNNTTINIQINTSDASQVLLSWNGSSNVSMVETSTAFFEYNQTVVGHGNFSFIATALDPALNANASTFSLIINNTAPNITQFAPAQTKLNISENTTLNFEINVTDVNNDTLTINWTSNGVQISTTENVSIFFNFSSSANYTINVSVNDGNATIDQSWMIEVNNTFEPPELNVSNTTVFENQTIQVNASSSDPNGDTVTITYHNTPNTSVNSSGGWQTSFTDSGTHTINVTASDGAFNVTKPVTLTIINVNRKVVIQNFSIFAGQNISNETLILNYTASDEDNDTFLGTITWFNDTTEISELENNTQVHKNLTSKLQNWTAQLSITDTFNTTIQNVTIEIVDSLPKASGNLTTRVYPNISTSYNLSEFFNDTDNDPITYELLTQGNTTANITNDNLTLTPNGTFNGSTNITINVSASPGTIFNWTFVVSYDLDGDGINGTSVGGSDCHDNDSVVFPGASCTRSGFSGSTYDSSCTCSGGTSTTSTSSSSGGGGGGGGGGGSSSSGSPSERVSQTFAEIPADTPTSINVHDLGATEVAFAKNTITLKNGATNVDVTVRKRDPASISESQKIDNVYQYIEVTTTLQSEEIEKVEIDFVVPQEWLDTNNFASAELRRYNNGWEVLPSRQIGFDGTTRTYRATSPGYSIFSVVGTDPVSTSEENATNATISAESEQAESESEQTTESESVDTEPIIIPWKAIGWSTAGLAVVALLTLIVYFRSNIISALGIKRTSPDEKASKKHKKEILKILKEGQK